MLNQTKGAHLWFRKLTSADGKVVWGMDMAKMRDITNRRVSTYRITCQKYDVVCHEECHEEKGSRKLHQCELPFVYIQIFISPMLWRELDNRKPNIPTLTQNTWMELCRACPDGNAIYAASGSVSLLQMTWRHLEPGHPQL